ncbi:MAG: EAL domain-containing protein [Magnetospirillum sp.]|nr:EAL domain-containing protein [Magnetospirillum sp.]
MADRDRDRFVALAFCRADMLFELDESLTIVFAGGATPPLLGATPDRLAGRPFLDLIATPDRKLAAEMLDVGARSGRIDDVILRLEDARGRRPNVAIAGYRVPDFDDHFFLAVKVEPVCQASPGEPPARDGDSGLMAEDSFAATAASRALAFQRAGGRPLITTVKVDNLDEMVKTLGASDRKRLMSTVGEILTRNSLGGDTAGRVGAEGFSYIHRDDVDTGEVTSRIEDAARRLFGKDAVKAHGHTLDADGAGMSEEQVAKAIAHTIRQFCATGEAGSKKSLAQVLKGMVSDTIDSVAYLRKVIAARDFDLVYMPVCDLKTGKVVHFEALTRFRDAKAGTSPFHLFCLAEEVGIVHELDLAICTAAVERVAALLSRNPRLPPVAINLSGLSLIHPTFPAALVQLLQRSGVPPAKLMFEMTESATIDDIGKANAVIQKLRGMGYRFCLDDFGAGSASFDYLNALDVDVVKFDGPVVKRACASPKGGDLLASMAKMCKAMGVASTAEMVEDKRMAAMVVSCGIDYGQGWHFGRPEEDPFFYAERFVK